MNVTTSVDTRRLVAHEHPGEVPASGKIDVGRDVADAPNSLPIAAIAVPDDGQTEPADAVSPRSTTVLIGLGIVVTVVVLDRTGLLSVPLVLGWLALLGRSI